MNMFITIMNIYVKIVIISNFSMNISITFET